MSSRYTSAICHSSKAQSMATIMAAPRALCIEYLIRVLNISGM